MENIIVVGSLAVGYHYLHAHTRMAVRTKDVDLLLSPRVKAIPIGTAVLEKLIDHGWEPWLTERWPTPGAAETPLLDLPAARLRPDSDTEWFLEFLTEPASAEDRDRGLLPIETTRGRFGLFSFGFLSLTSLEPMRTAFGLQIARPEMMALANLLEHPVIDPQVMSNPIAGRDIKRSSKDLGRVLAIAHLATTADEDALLTWPDSWLAGLRIRFPDDWAELAARAGSGLAELLASVPDLDEAHHTCINGLLAASQPPPSADDLRVAGERLQVDAIEPLATAAGTAPRR